MYGSLLIPALALTSFPTGVYRGTGTTWDLAGHNGPYTVEMSFQGDSYVERWESATRQGVLDVTARFGDGGRIDITIAGSTGAISGYCGGDVCHVEGIATNGANYEQTLWFEPGRIRKVGSETSGDGPALKRTMWESTLLVAP